MNSRWVNIGSPDTDAFKGYLSLPPTGSGPGILLIQEIFGVNAHIRGVADQYALDGYTVLAPDLFWRLEPRVELGYDGADREKAMALMQKVDADVTLGDLAAAIGTLRGLLECSGKVVALGYCLGGRLAYGCAADPGVDAAVCYYGARINNQLDRAGRIRCPLLFHFGEEDHAIPLEAVDAIRQTFGGRADVAIHTYPNAGHGFNCWARSAYHQPSAALAHGRTLEFLATVL